MPNRSRDDTHESSTRRIRSAHFAWIVIAFLTPIVVYLPAVLARYGFGESYRLLAFYESGPRVRHLMLAEGRPGFAVWAALCFGSVSGRIAALPAIRLVNLCAIGMTSVLVARVLWKAGLREVDAMLGGIAMMMLSPFQLFAATAGMGGAVVAAVFASIAALSTQGFVRPMLWLTAGQLTYQPAAMMYVSLVGARMLFPDLGRRAFRDQLRRFVIIAAPAALIELAVFLIGRRVFPAELLGAPRARLSFDPLSKLAWFFGLPIAQVTNLWVLRPNLLAGAVLATAIGACLFLTFREREDRWLSLGVAFALVPISYLPNLVVVENHSSFRSQPGLAALFFLFYMLIVHKPLRSRRAPFTIIMVVATTCACFIARHNVVNYMVRPQVRELQLVRNTLRELPRRYGVIGLRKAGFTDSLAPAVFGDEFGYPSTALPWSFIEITHLVLREQQAPGSPIPDLVDVLGAANRDAPAAPPTVTPDTVIDWGEVLRAERDRSASH
jgi:hypothetical protein